MKIFWGKKSESGQCQLLFDYMCIVVLICLHGYIVVAACTILNIPAESTFITKAATKQAALLLAQCLSAAFLLILYILSFELCPSFTHLKLVCTYLGICSLVFVIRMELAGFSGEESKLGIDGFEQHEAISIMLVQIIVFLIFRLDVDIIFSMNFLKSPFVKLRTVFGSAPKRAPTTSETKRSPNGRSSVHSKTSSAPSYLSEELPAYESHQNRYSNISLAEEIELKDGDVSIVHLTM